MPTRFWPLLGPVVVGISPRTGSPIALRWAAATALRQNTHVRAVLAWRAPRPPASTGGEASPGASSSVAGVTSDAEAAVLLAQYVASAIPGAESVEQRVFHGSPLQGLLTHGADASLIVIGSPATNRISLVRPRLLAPKLVLQAACPVVAMPLLIDLPDVESATGQGAALTGTPAEEHE